MNTQLNLFSTENRQQSLIQGINPKDCVISRFNTRKTRRQEDVQKLAERIKQNGFELTRAPWAYRNRDDNLEIFAGGTRLEAARQANVLIPIILFEGYSDEEIARLTDQDNENDEYHAPVSPVDVWAEYARLRNAEGWTQQQIAEAKGVSQTVVSQRLKLHNLPEDTKSLIGQNLLTESHLIEIVSILVDQYFSPWLTTEQAWEELAKWAVGHTVRQTKEKVGHWKSLIELAQKTYADFSENITLYDFSGDKPQPYIFNEKQMFIEELAEENSRSQASVKEAKGTVEIFVSENLDEYKIWIDEQTKEAARRAIKAKKIGDLLSRVHLGDFQETTDGLENDSIDLIFSDPPYSEDQIENYGYLACIAARILKPGGSLIVYAGHYALPQIFELMCPHLRYWWMLGIKHTGGLSSLTGKKVYIQWKPLLWFVKEKHDGDEFVFDLIESKQEKDLHEWQQGTIEAQYYIERLTTKGALVADPFGGSGTTVIAALETERDFWIGDIDPDNIDKIKNRILKWLDEREIEDAR